MAITLWGVQGTVNEVQWAKLAAGLSQKYTLVTGNPITSSGRTLTITPRLSVGCGVAVDNSTNESVVTPVPTTGQWFLLCLRRVWGVSRGASYVLINGPTTADAVQTATPATLPGTRNSTPGVMDDEPVAWVHARSSTTTLNIFQLSARPGATLLSRWGAWDAIEQGFTFARVENSGTTLLWRENKFVATATRLALANNISLPGGAHRVFTSLDEWQVLGDPMTAVGYWNQGIVAPVTGTYRLLLQATGDASGNLLIAAKKNNTAASIAERIALSIGVPAFSYVSVGFSHSLALAAGDVITLDALASVAMPLRALGSTSVSLEII